jgi:hypothetical protein
VRDDARLAAPNTYGSFWDAANRGNRLVHARRTVVIANGLLLGGLYPPTDFRRVQFAQTMKTGTAGDDKYHAAADSRR